MHTKTIDKLRTLHGCLVRDVESQLVGVTRPSLPQACKKVRKGTLNSLVRLPFHFFLYILQTLLLYGAGYSG